MEFNSIHSGSHSLSSITSPHYAESNFDFYESTAGCPFSAGIASTANDQANEIIGDYVEKVFTRIGGFFLKSLSSVGNLVYDTCKLAYDKGTELAKISQYQHEKISYVLTHSKDCIWDGAVWEEKLDNDTYNFAANLASVSNLTRMPNLKEVDQDKIARDGVQNLLNLMKTLPTEPPSYDTVLSRQALIDHWNKMPDTLFTKMLRGFLARRTDPANPAAPVTFHEKKIISLLADAVFVEHKRKDKQVQDKLDAYIRLREKYGCEDPKRLDNEYQRLVENRYRLLTEKEESKLSPRERKNLERPLTNKEKFELHSQAKKNLDAQDQELKKIADGLKLGEPEDIQRQCDLKRAEYLKFLSFASWNLHAYKLGVDYLKTTIDFTPQYNKTTGWTALGTLRFGWKSLDWFKEHLGIDVNCHVTPSIGLVKEDNRFRDHEGYDCLAHGIYKPVLNVLGELGTTFDDGQVGLKGMAELNVAPISMFANYHEHGTGEKKARHQYHNSDSNIVEFDDHKIDSLMVENRHNPKFADYTSRKRGLGYDTTSYKDIYTWDEGGHIDTVKQKLDDMEKEMQARLLLAKSSVDHKDLQKANVNVADAVNNFAQGNQADDEKVLEHKKAQILSVFSDFFNSEDQIEDRLDEPWMNEFNLRKNELRTELAFELMPLKGELAARKRNQLIEHWKKDGRNENDRTKDVWKEGFAYIFTKDQLDENSNCAEDDEKAKKIIAKYDFKLANVDDAIKLRELERQHDVDVNKIKNASKPAITEAHKALFALKEQADTKWSGQALEVANKKEQLEFDSKAKVRQKAHDLQLAKLEIELKSDKGQLAINKQRLIIRFEIAELNHQHDLEVAKARRCCEYAIGKILDQPKQNAEPTELEKQEQKSKLQQWEYMRDVALNELECKNTSAVKLKEKELKLAELDAELESSNDHQFISEFIEKEAHINTQFEIDQLNRKLDFDIAELELKPLSKKEMADQKLKLTTQCDADIQKKKEEGKIQQNIPPSGWKENRIKELKNKRELQDYEIQEKRIEKLSSKLNYAFDVEQARGRLLVKFFQSAASESKQVESLQKQSGNEQEKLKNSLLSVEETKLIHERIYKLDSDIQQTNHKLLINRLKLAQLIALLPLKSATAVNRQQRLMKELNLSEAHYPQEWRDENTLAEDEEKAKRIIADSDYEIVVAERDFQISEANRHYDFKVKEAHLDYNFEVREAKLTLGNVEAQFKEQTELKNARDKKIEDAQTAHHETVAPLIALEKENEMSAGKNQLTAEEGQRKAAKLAREKEIASWKQDKMSVEFIGTEAPINGAYKTRYHTGSGIVGAAANLGLYDYVSLTGELSGTGKYTRLSRIKPTGFVARLKARFRNNKETENQAILQKIGEHLAVKNSRVKSTSEKLASLDTLPTNHALIDTSIIEGWKALTNNPMPDTHLTVEQCIKYFEADIDLYHEYYDQNGQVKEEYETMLQKLQELKKREADGGLNQNDAQIKQEYEAKLRKRQELQERYMAENSREIIQHMTYIAGGLFRNAQHGGRHPILFKPKKNKYVDQKEVAALQDALIAIADKLPKQSIKDTVIDGWKALAIKLDKVSLRTEGKSVPVKEWNEETGQLEIARVKKGRNVEDVILRGYTVPDEHFTVEQCMKYLEADIDLYRKCYDENGIKKGYETMFLQLQERWAAEHSWDIIRNIAYFAGDLFGMTKYGGQHPIFSEPQKNKYVDPNEVTALQDKLIAIEGKLAKMKTEKRANWMDNGIQEFGTIFVESAKGKAVGSADVNLGIVAGGIEGGGDVTYTNRGHSVAARNGLTKEWTKQASISFSTLNINEAVPWLDEQATSNLHRLLTDAHSIFGGGVMGENPLSVFSGAKITVSKTVREYKMPRLDSIYINDLGIEAPDWVECYSWTGVTIETQGGINFTLDLDNYTLGLIPFSPGLTIGPTSSETNMLSHQFAPKTFNHFDIFYINGRDNADLNKHWKTMIRDGQRANIQALLCNLGKEQYETDRKVTPLSNELDVRAIELHRNKVLTQAEVRNFDKAIQKMRMVGSYLNAITNNKADLEANEAARRAELGVVGAKIRESKQMIAEYKREIEDLRSKINDTNRIKTELKISKLEKSIKVEQSIVTINEERQPIECEEINQRYDDKDRLIKDTLSLAKRYFLDKGMNPDNPDGCYDHCFEVFENWYSAYYQHNRFLFEASDRLETPTVGVNGVQRNIYEGFIQQQARGVEAVRV